MQHARPSTAPGRLRRTRAPLPDTPPHLRVGADRSSDARCLCTVESPAGLALEVIRPAKAEVGFQRNPYHSLTRQGFIRECDHFGGLSRIAAGNQEVGCDRHPVFPKSTQDSAANFVDGHAGKSVAKRLSLYEFVLATQPQMPRQLVQRGKGVNYSARCFGHWQTSNCVTRVSLRVRNIKASTREVPLCRNSNNVIERGTHNLLQPSIGVDLRQLQRVFETRRRVR